MTFASLAQALRRRHQNLGAGTEREIFMKGWEDIPGDEVLGHEFIRDHIPKIMFDMPSSKSHKTCAVVGRSPNILGKNRGALIDSHSAVFRSGDCSPAEWNPGDAGIKTTYCVGFWPRYSANGFRPILLEYRALALGWYTEDWFQKATIWINYMMPKLSYFEDVERDLEEWADPSEVESYRNASTIIDVQCKRNSLGCKKKLDLSSGYYSVALARTLCEKVDVYGFDTTTDPNAEYAHFDKHSFEVFEDTRRLVKDHPHPFPLERKVLMALHDHGNIHLDETTGYPRK